MRTPTPMRPHTMRTDQRGLTFLSYHPLVAPAAALVAGIVLERAVAVPGLLALAVTALLLVAWIGLLAVGRAATLTAAVGLLTFVGLGACAHHLQYRTFAASDVSRWAEGVGHPTELRATVVEEPLVVRAPLPRPGRPRPGDDRTVTTVQAEHVRTRDGWQRCTGRVRTTVAGHLLGVDVGDRVQIVGRLYRPSGPLNPGQFDWRDWLRRQRVRTCLSAAGPDAVRVIERASGRWWSRGVDALRRRGAAALRRWLRPDEAALASALLLGSRAAVEKGLTEEFTRTGTVHVLAVSGLHVGLLAWMVWGALGVVPGVPRRRRALVVALVAVLYALLTGARPPVLRATALTLVFCGSYATGRPHKLGNSLALAAIVVLWLNPSDLFNRGFQLSLLAVIALFYVSPVFRRPDDPMQRVVRTRWPWWRQAIGGGADRLRHVLLGGLCIWVVCLPLLTVTYHIVSPVGVVLTVVAMPLVATGLLTGFGTMVLGATGGVLVAPVAWACQATMQALSALVRGTAALDVGYWYTPGPPHWWVWTFYGLVGLWLARRRLRMPRGMVPAAMAALLVAGLAERAWPTHRADCLRVTFLAVGHGQAVLVEFPNGRTVLCDVGSIGSRDVGADVVAPFLWHRRVRRLDAVVLSHAQADHTNGLMALADRVPIGTVYVSPQFADLRRPSVRAMAEHLADRGIPIRFVWQGDRLTGLDPVQADVLHPPPHGLYRQPNDRSVALMLRYGRARVLLPGDVEARGIEDMMRVCPVPVDVLASPHHGSRTSNTWDFVRRMRARVVVISKGRRRVPGSTWAHYRQTGTVVRHTQRHGAVTVTVRPDRIEVTSFVDPDRSVQFPL